MRCCQALYVLLLCLLTIVVTAKKEKKKATTTPSAESIFVASEELMTWKQAAPFCLSFNQSNDRFVVANIANEVENSNAGIALRLINSATGEDLDAWLQGYKPEHSWEWGDRSRFTFTRWGPHEPNKNGSCLALRIQNGKAVWISDRCTIKKRVICQAFAFTKVFTLLEPTSLISRSTAAAQCEAQQGSLASIFSPAENIAVLRQASLTLTPEPQSKVEDDAKSKSKKKNKKKSHPTPYPTATDSPVTPAPSAKAGSNANGDGYIFLGAINTKIGEVPEESRSFLWSNGISFKPISYIDRNLSSVFVNWAPGYPLLDANNSCAAFRSVDGLWVNQPCDTPALGSLCQVSTVEKTFKVLTDFPPMSQSEAGNACAQDGGQLVSIKTTTEYQTAQTVAIAAKTPQFWTSGMNFGDAFLWGDGQLFYRDNVPVGVINFFFGADNGSCVMMTCTGEWLRQPCDNLFHPMCEYVNEAGIIPVDKYTVSGEGCYAGCLASYQGDKVCDPVCNHYTCQFDQGDCGPCSPGCPYQKLGNGVCDEACFNALCAFDVDDCFKTSRRLSDPMSMTPDDSVVSTPHLPSFCNVTSFFCDPAWIGDKYCDLIACGQECDIVDCQSTSSTEQCSPTCSPTLLTNGVCDRACDSVDCDYDGGLCPICSLESCDMAAFNEPHTECLEGCNHPSCQYDLGNCLNETSSLCAPNCYSFMISDEVCQAACNTEACDWDGGDCPSRSYCPYPVNYLDYGCLPRCNTPLFKFQYGACSNSCLSSDGCTLEMLGNGVCDAVCDNPECGMDGGDCGTCSTSCSPFELDNKKCHATCNSTACGFDGGDCS